MSSLLESLQSHSGILMVLLLVVVVILLICVFNLSLGLNRLNRKYTLFMKGKDGQSLERLFKRKFDLIEKLVRSTDDNGEEIEKIWKVMDKSLNKYGIVKYDAFEDMGGLRPKRTYAGKAVKLHSQKINEPITAVRSVMYVPD